MNTVTNTDITVPQIPTIFPKPAIPQPICDITPRMRHERGSTEVGQSIIYHTEDRVIADLQQPIKKARGPDKKTRKPREWKCQNCKSSECNGKWPKGTCSQLK